MKKLIHSDWELDLTPFKISETEENSDFNDNLFSKISLPFEIDLTLDLDKNFGFISSYNTSPQTLYNVKFQDGDIISDAIFEILEENNGKLQCNYEFGLDEFPSWDKKLSELSLHDFDLPEGINIYQHAQSLLNQTYPTVDYNFPMIHTEIIDTSDETWEYFEKIINKYVNGNFIENSIDVEQLIFYNKNYMQPLIYWLYILKKGVTDGGFTLHGDVLTDPVLLKKMIFCPKEPFKKAEKTSQFITIKGSEFTTVLDVISGVNFARYNLTVPVPKWGRYLLQGTIRVFEGPFGFYEKTAAVAFNGGLLYNNYDYTDEIFYLDIYFTSTNSSTNDLTFEVVTFNPGDEELIVDLELICLVEFDIAGVPIPNISDYNKINLKNVVPDINFSDFVNATRKWRNYSFEVRGKEVWMNKITNTISNATTESLEDKEVKSPARKFQQGMSFLLKFIDVDTKTYTWAKVFHSVTGFVNANYKTDSKTNTIEINAVPLPIVNKSNITTATAFEKDESKIYAVFYEGLQNSKNITTDPADMLLPKVHLDCWNKWFIFRINAVNFKWTFLADEIKASALKVRSKIYAYRNNHLVKSIVKTQVNQSIVEVEIETEAIK